MDLEEHAGPHLPEAGKSFTMASFMRSAAVPWTGMLKAMRSAASLTLFTRALRSGT